MKNTPLISIIVPVYNVEEYIAKCISSIMQQTYNNLQIILVDDGSTDQSGRICDEFAERDKRIHVIHKKNGGLVSARKAGLAIANGLYIGFVDGDDFVNNNMYERMIENLILTEADFVHTGYYRGTFIISQLKSNIIDTSKDKAEFLNYYVLSLNNEEHMSPSLCSKLFKAELIKKSYYEVPEELSYGEDLISFIVCIMHSNRASLLDSSYYNYCVRSTSMTHKKMKFALLNGISLFQEIERILKKYGCYSQVKDTLINEWLGTTICYSLMQTSKDEFKIQCYGIKNQKFLEGKKIVLYGAGKIGRDYYSQISRFSKCKLAAWIDANYQSIHYDCIDLMGPEMLRTLNFDILIIAIKERKEAEKIKKWLMEHYWIEESKIVWIKPEYDY